jgi:type IV pilus assembly protein PilA
MGRGNLIRRIALRARVEAGFTLIELLVVLVVIGILLAIAVPTGMGFKARAHNTTAKANVREARPAIEAFFAENDGTAADADLDASTSGYEGMTVARLQAIDSGISVAGLAVGTVTTASFCVSSTNNGNVWHQDGPSASIVTGPCP